MPLNETDTCRTYVLPKPHSAGWEDTQICEQKSFTDGRIVMVGNRAIRLHSVLSKALREELDYVVG